MPLSFWCVVVGFFEGAGAWGCVAFGGDLGGGGVVETYSVIFPFIRQ